MRCGDYGVLCYACSLPAHELTQFPGCDAPLPLPALHFVGFRGDEYTTAVRIWGKPDFFHQRWDRRAKREIGPSDTIIFAKGTEHDEVSRYNGQDLFEDDA